MLGLAKPKLVARLLASNFSLGNLHTHTQLLYINVLHNVKLDWCIQNTAIKNE